MYARVSSADQEPDLDRQVTRVTTWATGVEYVEAALAASGRRAAANRAERAVAAATSEGAA